MEENKEIMEEEVVRGYEVFPTSDLEVTDEVIKEYGEMPTEVPTAPETHKESDAYETSD